MAKMSTTPSAAWRETWAECADRLKQIKHGLDVRTLRTSTLERLASKLADAEALVEHDDPESEE